MGREARLNAALWRLVTNRDVADCADPECKTCDGDGFVPSDATLAVCRCAPERFNRTYQGRLRIRNGQVEYKALISLAP